jgi:hypothetical protein
MNHREMGERRRKDEGLQGRRKEKIKEIKSDHYVTALHVYKHNLKIKILLAHP